MQPGGCLESAHLEMADLVLGALVHWGHLPLLTTNAPQQPPRPACTPAQHLDVLRGGPDPRASHPQVTEEVLVDEEGATVWHLCCGSVCAAARSRQHAQKLLDAKIELMQLTHIAVTQQTDVTP